jgi:serine/threonine protein kinase
LYESFPFIPPSSHVVLNSSEAFRFLVLPAANQFIGDLGRFLAEALTNNDKKSLLRGYFGCLASALRYLHDRQIRHRDIKPPNILVKGDTVYLADFGIALDWSEMTRGTTTADTAKSPIYCAPEVARSEPRGQSADIWSLGCVFVEMVTVLKGSSVEDMRSNFKKASGSYMFHHNIQACDQWLSELKDKYAIDNPPIGWCRKMLLFDRNERYTACQLLEAIQLESEPDHSKYVNQSFCGDCCMDQEHVSSDDNDTGEDPWADSDQEDTLRPHDVSVQKSVQEHMPDIPEPGSRESTSDVPDILPRLGLATMSSRPENPWKPSGGHWHAPSKSTMSVPDRGRSVLERVGSWAREEEVREEKYVRDLADLAREEEMREEGVKKDIAAAHAAQEQRKEEWEGANAVELAEQRRAFQGAEKSWRRISGDIVGRVAQFENLALITPHMQRPMTPPNQNVEAEKKVKEQVRKEEKSEKAETIELDEQVRRAFEEVKRGVGARERMRRERIETAIRVAEEPEKREADAQEVMRRERNGAATRAAENPEKRYAPAPLTAAQAFLKNQATSASLSSAAAAVALQDAMMGEGHEAATKTEEEKRNADVQRRIRRMRNGTATRAEEKKEVQLVESVSYLEEGERKERPTNEETKEVPPVRDRWEQIRRNAAERAAQQHSEDQSRGGFSPKTNRVSEETSGEESTSISPTHSCLYKKNNS